MSGLPKVELRQMIETIEREVIDRAMDAVRKTLRVARDPGTNQPHLDRLILESVDADLALQDVCAVLADLRGQRLDETN